MKQKTFANILIILFLFCALAGLYGEYDYSRPGDYEKAGRYLSDLFNFTRLFFECFAGILIVVVWLNISSDNARTKEDWGLGWLASAILAWCIGDCIKIFDADLHIENATWIHTSVSTVNSIFFLVSIKYLEIKEQNAIEWLSLKLKNYYITSKINTNFLASNKIPFCTLVIVLLLNFALRNGGYAGIPDLLLSIVTTAALLIFFNIYFKERYFEYMHYFVAIASVVILLAQLYNLADNFGGTYNFEPDILSKDIVFAIYRPFIIVLFFIVAVGALRFQKEKQAEMQKRDMNHAIRGTLNILHDDIKNKLNLVRQDEEQFETFIALEDMQLRVEAMYDLHDLVHKETKDNFDFESYLKRIKHAIQTGLDYGTNCTAQFEISKGLKLNRTLSRKVAGILVELAINASKVARKLDKQNTKKLNINVIANKKKLVISVEDNGTWINQHDNSNNKSGYGLKRLYTTVEADLKGHIKLKENKFGGTTFTVFLPLSNIKVK